MKHYYLVEGTKRNNIGDILQGMVAAQFLDVNATAVDREKLNLLNKEKKGFLLANGWFMHDYSLFPPPANIKPFYISIHVANSEILKQTHIREHFKMHAPIGCRDNKTLHLFLGWGIPAYYSGCLTITTLPKKSINKKDTEVFLIVDNMDHPIPDLVFKKIESLLEKKIIKETHDPDNISVSFNDYVLLNKSMMQSLLNRYCIASLVITTKIHCALPCLGMGANVVLIHPNPTDPRLQTVRKYMQIISFDKLLKSKKFIYPRIRVKSLHKHKIFLTNLVKQAVHDHQNPIRSSKNLCYRIIKYRSFLLAYLFRMIILFLLRTGFANKRIRRVFN